MVRRLRPCRTHFGAPASIHARTSSSCSGLMASFMVSHICLPHSRGGCACAQLDVENALVWIPGHYTRASPAVRVLRWVTNQILVGGILRGEPESLVLGGGVADAKLRAPGGADDLLVNIG